MPRRQQTPSTNPRAISEAIRQQQRERRELLRNVLETRRMTQAELARELQLRSRSSISHMLSGRTAVSDRIATALRQMLVADHSARLIRVSEETRTLMVDTAHANDMDGYAYYAHLPYCAACMAQAYAMRGGQRVSVVPTTTTRRDGAGAGPVRPLTLPEDEPTIGVNIDTSMFQRATAEASRQLRELGEAVRRPPRRQRPTAPVDINGVPTTVSVTAEALVPAAPATERQWLGEIEDE